MHASPEAPSPLIAIPSKTPQHNRGKKAAEIAYQRLELPLSITDHLSHLSRIRSRTYLRNGDSKHEIT
jgi:hypothetical protein